MPSEPTFSVEHEPRENRDLYTYRVLKNGYLVARYWHDFRMDAHGIDFLDDRRADLPMATVLDFLEDDDQLTPRAIEFLELELTKRFGEGVCERDHARSAATSRSHRSKQVPQRASAVVIAIVVGGGLLALAALLAVLASSA